MARSPRTRRAAIEILPDHDDGTGLAAERAREDNEATLDDMLGELASITTANAKVTIYKEPQRGGQWAYVKELGYPLETAGLLDELRQEWGGGVYFFRVFADKKIVTTKKAVIAGDPTPKKVTDNADHTALILKMAESGKSDTMQMMQLMMTMQQANAQQMAQASQQQQNLMMGLITAIISKPQENPVAAIAPLLEIVRGNQSNTPMSEMIASMAAMRDLIAPGEGGGGGDDNWLASAGKSLLPALGKMVETAATAPPQQAQVMAPPQMRPLPTLPPIAPVMTPNPEPVQPILPGIKSENPVIALVGEDVIFFANRNYPPDLAAEAVLQRISDAGLEQSHVFALVIRFQSSPDWIAELAGEGVDLSSRREWATEFLQSLLDQYSEGENVSDTGGGGGSEGDTGFNAGGDGSGV